MTLLYRSNTPVTLTIALTDPAGNALTAASATASVSDQEGQTLAPAPAVVLDTPSQATVTVDAAANDLGADYQGVRLVELAVVDSDGNTHNVQAAYALDAGNRLQKGINSFLIYAKAVQVALTMPENDCLTGASINQAVLALIQAFHNIALAPVVVTTADGTQSSPSELDATALNALDADTLVKLERAQVAEAIEILGLDPTEERRRAGLISQSHGEVTEFYRTAKPLNMPIGRKTARELSGLMVWAKPIGRA